MNKFSRPLTILVTVLAVVYMAVAAAGTATWTNWKAVTDAQKAELDRQQSILSDPKTGLDPRISTVEDGIRLAAEESIKADIAALTDPATGRESELEKMLADLEQQAHQLAQQVEAAARKTDAKLDELKQHREETVRLRGQYDELVSQKLAAQADAKRLQDLLYQARAVLDRVRRRQEALKSQIQ